MEHGDDTLFSRATSTCTEGLHVAAMAVVGGVRVVAKVRWAATFRDGVVDTQWFRKSATGK